MGVLYGIDVSKFQGRVDYDAVKRSGVSFVIAKATEGHTYLDPYYATNKKAIRAAGLIPGAYHFLRPLNGASIATQADWFCEYADPEAIHALDVEGSGPLEVEGFVAAYRRHYPMKTILMYTGRDLWTKVSKVPYDGVQYGPLWAAGVEPNRYVGATGSLSKQWGAVTGNAGLPWLGWTKWTIMQFTDHAQVPGVNGGVDGNAFGGTVEELKALTGLGGVKEDDMPTSEEVAAAVWSTTFKEYVDEDGDGTRDARTVSDVLFDAHRQAVLAYRATDDLKTRLASLEAKVLGLTSPVVQVDPAAVEAAVSAALAAAGVVGSVSVDAVRSVLVDVLEKTRLSATPPE